MFYIEDTLGAMLILVAGEEHYSRSEIQSDTFVGAHSFVVGLVEVPVEEEVDVASVESEPVVVLAASFAVVVDIAAHIPVVDRVVDIPVGVY